MNVAWSCLAWAQLILAFELVPGQGEKPSHKILGKCNMSKICVTRVFLFVWVFLFCFVLFC
jgi:hypothetical protein